MKRRNGGGEEEEEEEDEEGGRAAGGSDCPLPCGEKLLEAAAITSCLIPDWLRREEASRPVRARPCSRTQGTEPKRAACRGEDCGRE